MKSFIMKFISNIKSELEIPSSMSFVLSWILMWLGILLIGIINYPYITAFVILIICVLRVIWTGVTGK